jgi:hypothetical protein
MKKLYVLGMAIALMAPMAVLATGPAGAAAAGTKCGKPSGSITLTPGLDSVKRVQTIKIALPVKGCVGGGVTGGSFSGSLKTTPINIAGFAASTKPLKLTAKITWNTKATSTFTATTTTKVKGKVITSSISGKISAGLFKGLSVSSAQTVKLGKLVGGKVKNLTITGTTPFTIK